MRPPARGCALLLAAAGAAGAAPGGYARPGARMLVLEVPLAPDAAAITLLALPPGIELDASRPGRVLIADYPTADIGWAGRPGASALASFPHKELRVQLPVSQTNGSAGWWHDAYAVVTDDVAVLAARDGAGVPAKLGDVVFPAAPAAGGAATFSAARRGVDVLRASGTRGAAVAPAALGPAVLGRTLNLFGTQSMLGTGATLTPNNILLAANETAAVRAAWRFDGAVLRFASDIHEPLAVLFGNASAASAGWWMEVDAGADAAPPPVFAGAIPGNGGGLRYFLHAYMLRYGGAPVRPPTEQYDPDSGFSWQNGRFVWATLRVNATAVASQLPPGATLADDEARLFCAWYPTARLNDKIGSMVPSAAADNFPYHEFAIRLYINVSGEVRRHVVYILVDDEMPLTAGRDMLGTPKKLANFTFPDAIGDFAQGSSVAFRITRRGVPVVEFGGTVGENRTDPAPGLTDNVSDVSVFSTQFPLYFGAASGGAGQPVYSQWTGSYNVRESRRIDSPTVKWTGAAAEPIKAWFVDAPPVDAGYLRQDYGKATDLGGGPTLGRLPAGAARRYWQDTYQTKYGGAPQ